MICSCNNLFANSLKSNHNTYNVCSGQPRKFSSILEECILSLGGSKHDIHCKDDAPSQYNYSGDCSRFESEFNYKISKTSFSAASHVLSAWLQSIN